MRKIWLLVLVTSLAIVAAGCGGGNDEAAPPTTVEPAATAEAAATGEATAEGATGEAATAETADECAPENLNLVNPGQLTIGTGNPAYPPWFEGGTTTDEWELNDPANGQGFEGAVAYAVAERLGFAPEQVTWVAVPFAKSFAPGPKDFDFVLQQISYTPKRAKAVGFSESYYESNEALVSLEGSKIAGAKSLADLKEAKLGVPVGTTSYDYVVDVIKPDQEPAVYDDQTGAIQALENGQIDGIVVDLPSAFYITAAQLDGGVIVGQFPSVGGQRESFAMAFELDNPLIPCVNEALQEIKSDGTLDGIYQEWLADKASAPVIQ